MRRFCLCFVSLLALCLMFACSNAAGGGGNDVNDVTDEQDYPTKATGKYFSAEATPQGILFTMQPLPEEYRNWGLWIAQKESDTMLTRADPEWTDRSKPWTGLYPLVDYGKNYVFEFCIANNNDVCEINRQPLIVKIKAIGGLGELKYPSNWSIDLSCTKEKISAKINGFVIPKEISGVFTTALTFFYGTGMESGVWDGEWAAGGGSDELKYSVDFLPSSDVYKRIIRGLKTDYRGKSFFCQYSYNFNLPTYSGFKGYSTAVKNSNNVYVYDIDDYPETSLVKTVAQSDGILFTIKKPETFSSGVSHIDICWNGGVGADLSGFSNQMESISYLYPLVEAGKKYTFNIYIHPNGSGDYYYEYVNVNAIGGLGECSYDSLSSGCVNLSCQDKIPSVAVSGISPPSLLAGDVSSSWLWYGFEAQDSESGNSYDNKRFMSYETSQIEGLENMGKNWIDYFRSSFEETGKKNFYVRIEIRFKLNGESNNSFYNSYKKELLCSNVVEYK